MKIREAKVNDWEKLRALLVELVHEDPPVALELEPLIMKGKEFLANFPRGNLGHFSVAEEDDKIVGFCYLAVPKFYRPVAYIGVAVQKEYRKKEIGTLLFYHVGGWAEGTKIQYIIADIWSWNKGSIKFFEKLGFMEKEVFKDKFRGLEKDKVRLVQKIMI